MDLAVFYEIVVPLLEMGSSILVMISTPVDSFNFYTKLLELRDPETGQHVFSVYEMELICKLCLQGPKPEDCKHNLKYIPPWKSGERLELVKLILGQENVTTLKRESMGVVSDSGDSLVEKKYVERLFAAERVELDPKYPPKTVILACDPNVRGTDISSEFAITSIAKIRGHNVILGMDSWLCANPTDCEQLLFNHILALKNRPLLQDAVIVFACERNTGHEGGWLARTVEKFTNTYCLREKPNEVGVWTDNPKKLRYVFSGRHALHGESVSLLRDFVCANPFLKPEEREKVTLDKLRDQLIRFKLHEKQPKNPYGKTSVVASGKVNNEGENSTSARDDLAMSWFIGTGLMDMMINRELDWVEYNKVFP